MAGLDDYRNYAAEDYSDFPGFGASGSLLPPSQPQPSSYQFPVPLTDEGILFVVIRSIGPLQFI